MDFIINNIVWFIVGGVVILMTIIGYLADKTDFAGKKYRDKMLAKESENNEKKKNKKEKLDKESSEPEIEEEQISPVVEEQNEQSLESLYNPVLEETSNEVQTSDIPEELFAPINPSSIDNNIEQLDTSVTSDIPEVEPTTLEMPAETANNDFVPKQNLEELPVQNLDLVNVSETIEEAPLQDNVNVEPVNFQVEAPVINEEVLSEPVQPELLNESAPEQSFSMTDDEQFNKIFPEDPVIIGDEHKNSEEVKDTLLPQEVPPEQEIEDVWKF